MAVQNLQGADKRHNTTDEYKYILTVEIIEKGIVQMTSYYNIFFNHNKSNDNI